MIRDALAYTHLDAVSSAVWHPSGAVLTSCSGSRSDRFQINGEESPIDLELHAPVAKLDNSLRLWTL